MFPFLDHHIPLISAANCGLERPAFWSVRISMGSRTELLAWAAGKGFGDDARRFVVDDRRGDTMEADT
jgi:hypothetical protein